MYAKIASLLVLAVAVFSANVHTGLDACIIDCSAAAASAAGCLSYADLPCVYTNTNFQNAANACITATCPSGDLAAAKALQQLECVVVKLIGSKSL